MQLDKTSKITTIIGLIFEGLGVFMFALTGTGMALINSMSRTEIMDFFGDEITSNDLDIMLMVFSVLAIIFIIIGFIALVFFLVNLVLFTKLINGKYTEEQASKVLLYQAIYGGINLMFNQILGVLYLVSGIQGRQKLLRKDTIKKEY